MSDAPELIVKLTKAEQKSSFGTVSYTFRVSDGHVVISEDWAMNDEIYGPGISIGIPPRVWAIAWPWLVKHAAVSA